MLVNKSFFAIFARFLCVVALVNPAFADAALFASDTGFRIAKYRAPVPESPPGITAIDVETVALENRRNVVLLDVRPLKVFEIDTDGTWIVPEPIKTLPGAIWLPGVGVGALEPWAEEYLARSLKQVVDAGQKIIVFCRVDCWHSWNAAQRVAAHGYDTQWFDGGVEAWEDFGGLLEPAMPWPVPR